MSNAMLMMEQNYGVEYPREKVQLLFSMIEEDKWSEERFKRTLKWILKNRPYPTWSISDWFSYGVKVYPYAWYLKQQSEAGPYRNVLKEMDVYKMADGVFAYRWHDREELPFEKV